MKIVTVTYRELEDPAFYLELNIMEKFLSNNNLTLEEAHKKPILEILQPPFNMGTYLHNPTGPAYVLKVKEEYKSPKGVTVPKDGIVHAEYWFEGRRKTAQEEEKMKHSIEFGDKFQDLINNEEWLFKMY